MINYIYSQKVIQVKRVLLVTMKATSDNTKLVKSFIVEKEDGKYGFPTIINADGKTYKASDYEVGECPVIGENND